MLKGAKLWEVFLSSLAKSGMQLYLNYLSWNVVVVDEVASAHHPRATPTLGTVNAHSLKKKRKTLHYRTYPINNL